MIKTIKLKIKEIVNKYFTKAIAWLLVGTAVIVLVTIFASIVYALWELII